VTPPDLIGWRVWLARDYGGRFGLVGPWSNVGWRPGIHARETISAAPSGVFAYREQSKAIAYPAKHLGGWHTGELYVIGQVALWAPIRVKADEVYGQYGYPVSLDTTLDFRKPGSTPPAADVLPELRRAYISPFALELAERTRAAA
jgi:hypothetical protein